MYQHCFACRATFSACPQQCTLRCPKILSTARRETTPIMHQLCVPYGIKRTDTAPLHLIPLPLRSCRTVLSLSAQRPTLPSPDVINGCIFENCQPQVESDENAFLRRRLEAIERTTLKLNIGGTSNELQMLRERLDLESAEVARLRLAVVALQNDKLALSEVGFLRDQEEDTRKKLLYVEVADWLKPGSSRSKLRVSGFSEKSTTKQAPGMKRRTNSPTIV